MSLKTLIVALLFGATAFLPDLAAAGEAHAADGSEARMGLPRHEDGSIDTIAILHKIRDRIAAGARDILFRGDVNPNEARRLFLQGRLIEDIAARLPDDGVEREVRVRGIVDARVHRAGDGELRARIEGVHLGPLSAAQRYDLARRVALQSGVDHVRIQGLDASGDKVRVDFRAERAERPERTARVERVRVERAERPDRVERPDRPERIERPERPERPDKPERHGRR